MEDRLLGKKPYALYRDPLVIIFVILLFLLLCRILFAVRFMGIYVVGDSMSPGLTGAASRGVPGGDFLFVNKFDTPDYGDIVVLEKPYASPDSEDRYVIKRVIALGGDKVYMEDGVVYVMYEGEEQYTALEEDYVLEENCDPLLPYNTYRSADDPMVVGEDEIFVLGDNRNVSRDSRYSEYGCFSYSQLAGVVTDWSLSLKGFITDIYTLFAF